MVNVDNDLIYEALKEIQDDVSATRHDVREVKSELQAIRGRMLATQQDIANIYATMGRHEVRFDRIERRLGLMEPAQ